MLVRSTCLLCWKLMRSQTPGAYIDSFTRLQHQVIRGVPRLLPQAGNCCVTGGTPICQRHTGTPNTPGKCPSAAAEHWENAASRQGHSSHRISLTKTRVLLWRNNFYLTSITKIQAITGVKSPQHSYQHPCCFIWGGWLRSMPSANSRVRHCTTSPELAEVGICSKLEAQLQWHLTNDPMQGALLFFPGHYPDWQGARNLKNRCLGLLCYCVFNGFSQERRWKGRALRLGPAALGCSCSVPLLKDTAQRPAPRPDAQLGTATANWVTHFTQAMEILQHAQARFLPAFRKYWFIISIIKSKTNKKTTEYPLIYSISRRLVQW